MPAQQLNGITHLGRAKCAYSRMPLGLAHVKLWPDQLSLPFTSLLPMGMVHAEATGHNCPVRPTASHLRSAITLCWHQFFNCSNFHPSHPIIQGLASTGACAGRDCPRAPTVAGLDRQTAAASGAYCLLQPPTGRPLISKKLTSL